MTRDERLVRAARIEAEDERQNGLRTTCTSAALNYFGVNNHRYSQTMGDCVNLLRRAGYKVRSRTSALGRNAKVCDVKKRLEKVSNRKGCFLVFVKGHVLVQNSLGITVVDTDPRKVDRRKVTKIYEIYRSMF
jgi:hypothetical protein